MMSFARIVARAMDRIAPLRLAESWDNVGLLLESPSTRENSKSVLLTIDLTPAVVEEALSMPVSVIVAYHPPIFRPLTALTLSNPLQASLLRCAAAGISVFSPHTALDCAQGGINDWLAGGLGTRLETVLPIKPKDGETQHGPGRYVTYVNPVPLQSVAASIKSHIGLKHVQLAESHSAKDIKTVAVCAGSGGSLLKDVQADLYFTGEMSHHEILAAVSKGTHVILCGHDNTERGFLQTLQGTLERELSSEPGGPFQVAVSKSDKHPLEIL